VWHENRKVLRAANELHGRFSTIPVLVIVLLAFISFAAPAMNAQVAGGSITGTIRGENGSVMPGAQISILDATGTIVRTTNADDDGLFAAPNLPPGRYEMKVSAPGFVTQEWTEIFIAVGAERALNVLMQAGSPEQVTRIVAPPSSANQASATVGGSVGENTVRDAPLNGRDWAQLATLEAGVTGVQTGSSSSAGNPERGFGAAISISGARPDQNGYRLDGISINDYSNGAPGSVLGDNLGIDAVEQVSVLGSNYPAEYGRTSGGVINAVTRSGKNAFHGTVYEFIRNSALDARNFFDGPKIPPFKRNQFGASGGLPIRKDRTFIFGDYEGLRQSLGETIVNTVPSAAARNGQLSTGNVTVDPAVARFIAAFYPLPNGPLLGAGNTGIFTFAEQVVTGENYFTIRLDHKFSGKDSFGGTYMRDNSKTVQPGTFDELFTNVISSREVATLQEQHIFSSTFLNVARFGFSRAVGSVGGVSKVLNPLMLDPSYGFSPGGFAGAVQGVPGVTNFTGAPSILGTLQSSRSLAWNSFQAGDDAFLTRGKHTLKFGFLAERMQDNQLNLSNVNGTFRFNSLSNFLTNQKPLAFQGNRETSAPSFGMRQTLLAAYVQDDFRWGSNLTLNAGLRYEMVTVPTEAHNRIDNLRNLTDAQPSVGTEFFHNPTLRNFEPRVGFAWNPRGGHTLVRGGFGIFDVLPLPYEFTITIQHGVPFVQEIYGSTFPAGSFPTGAYQQLISQTTSSRSVYVENNPKRNYVTQWNLNVAQELSSTLALTVGYVGSRGVHQPYRVDNIDMVLPTLTPAGYVFPPVATSHTLNPNFGRISAMLWQANSFYDALQVNITKRVSHGFQFRGAYTWGKSIDTLSATAADDTFPNGLYNQLFFDQSTTRGLSDFNISHSAVISLTWEIPGPQLSWTAPKWMLSGWQVGGLYKVSTGQPFTPLLGGDPLGMKLEESSEPVDRVAGSGCQTMTNPGNPNHYIKTQCLAFPNPSNRRGNLGRNTIIGPGLSKVDLSVFKNNRVKRISESFNAQFRAEFFNILNRANFSSPTDNREIFDQTGNAVSSAGLITSTQTTSRQIQFALKLIW
jgi:hypothetical protein